MATQVTMEDGTESPLVDHLRDAHQKGTRGFTEEYLDSLHRTLHRRKREPEEELEHTHPDAMDGVRGDGAGSGQQPGLAVMDSRHRDMEVPGTLDAAGSTHRDREVPGTSDAASSKHRDREQEMSEPMKSKNRDRNKQRSSQDMNGQHRDRYGQHTQEIPDQRTGGPQAGHGQAGNGQAGNGQAANGEFDREHEDELVSAGGQQRNGKHRKQRH